MAETNEITTTTVTEEQSDGSKLWKRIKDFSASGFGKGIIITAIIFIGALVLAGGWMGTVPGDFFVNAVPVSTFGEGISAGFAKALEFLIHPIGLATLLGGGIAGSYIESHKNKEIITRDNTRVIKEREIIRSAEPQREIRKDSVNNRKSKSAPSFSFDASRDSQSHDTDSRSYNFNIDNNSRSVREDNRESTQSPAFSMDTSRDSQDHRSNSRDYAFNANNTAHNVREDNLEFTQSPAFSMDTSRDSQDHRSDPQSYTFNADNNSRYAREDNHEFQQPINYSRDERYDPIRQDNPQNDITNTANFQQPQNSTTTYDLRQLSNTTPVYVPPPQQAPTAQNPTTQDNNQNNNVGSEIAPMNNTSYSATELKRRAERETAGNTKTI